MGLSFSKSSSSSVNKNDKKHVHKFVRTNNILDHPTDPLDMHYNLGKKLGEGAFGVVNLVTSKKSGKTYACKSISKLKLTSKKQITDIRKEIYILQSLKAQPNVVNIVDVFEDNSNVYIIMELCSGGELFDEIINRKTFNEADAAAVTRFMLNVIVQCNQGKVIHRDLKPENFLFAEPASKGESPGERVLKVTDFGLSAFFESESQLFKDMVGTPFYVAPEVLKSCYTVKADVWSVGVILFILLSGRPPFGGKTDESILRRILAGKYSMEKDPWPSISEPAKEVVRLLLTYNFEERPSAEEMLKHPWVREDGIASLDPIPMAAQALSHMKEFYTMNKLKKYAIVQMANHIPLQDLKQIKALFDFMDKDQNGYLTLKEISSALESKNLAIPGLDIGALIQAYDSDFDDRICYKEFITALLKRARLVTRENILRIFQEIDLNQDGKISPEEIRKALGEQNAAQFDMEKVIKEVDADDNGLIDLDEFVDMFTNELEQETDVSAESTELPQT